MARVSGWLVVVSALSGLPFLIVLYLLVRNTRRERSVDYSTAPAEDLVKELADLIESRPGRMEHYLPDLALKMLATQVLQYARAFGCLQSGRFVSWSFPIARTAFETAEDLAYLAFAPNPSEYDRRGALAHVGAEIALSKSSGLAQAAVPNEPVRKPLPQKERIEALIAEWKPFRDESEDIVRDAYAEARAEWNRGTKSWTLLARDKIHSVLQAELGDDQLAGVLRSWYDLLASRTHPGLHSPQLRRHATGHEFLVDGDEDNAIPEASVRFSLILAIHALKHQYEVWGSDPGAP